MSVTSYVEQLEGRRLFTLIDQLPYLTHYMNGDTKADLAVVTNKGLRLSTGNGDGSFTPAQNVSLPAKPLGVLAGDFNNDGRGDLLAPMPNGIIAILIGLQSTPTPGAPLVGPPSFFDVDVDLPPWRSLAVGDVDDDGRDDLMFVSFDDKNGPAEADLFVFHAQFTGTETFTYSFTQPSPFGPRARIALGDVNGDGFADLVGLNARGGVDMSRNIAGRFDDIDIVHVVGSVGIPGSNVVHRVVVGDVNGDDRAEIVAFADSGARIFYIADDGEVEDHFNTNIGPLSPALQRGLVLGDINGDGDKEFFIIDKAGRTRFFDVFIGDD